MKKIILNFVMFFATVTAFCVILPSSAFALTAEEVGAIAPSGSYCYEDDENGDVWVQTNGSWVKCDVVDNSYNLDAVVSYVRQKMIKREENITVLFATKSNGFSDLCTGYESNSDPAYIDFTSEKAELFRQRFFSTVYSLDGIIDNKLRAVSGDYLRKNVTDYSLEVGRPIASDHTGEDGYRFFSVSFLFDYYTDAAQEQEISEFVEQWNNVYIKNSNSIVQKDGLTINEKNYYTVKTAYKFLALNTIYDYETRNNQANPTQYNSSHSAYGAFFGNTKNSENVVDLSKYVWSTDNPSQKNVVSPSVNGQGLAVCEGYTQAMYYICQYNGIDCRIVEGDYTEPTNSDPHAWNTVKLCDYNSDTYDLSSARWYYLDSTFANSIETDRISLVDYSYFLRGSENVAFSPSSHQQSQTALDGALSTADYVFGSASLDFGNSWAVLTRRADINNFKEVENYFIISPEKKYYKLEKGALVEQTGSSKEIVYSATLYYYNITVQDLVNGVECKNDYSAIENSGSYDLSALNISTNEVIYPFTLVIQKKDMSDINNYYSLKWNEKEIVNNEFTEITQVEFKGSYLDFTVEISDIEGHTLRQSIDYVVKIYDSNSNEVNPKDPGLYYIIIDFNMGEGTNFCNVFTIPFEIVKCNFSSLSVDEIKDVAFGSDVVSGCNTLILNDSTVLVRGVDYEVALADGSGLNYGDDGYVIYTALAGNKYVAQGTTLYRHYIVSIRCDLSFLSGQSTNSKYAYTGAEIRPNDFVISISLGGKIYVLQEGTDYNIVSYSNNINPGTAYVNIEFIGNYSGSAQMSFIIASADSQGNQNNTNNNTGGGQTQNIIDVVVSDTLVYNGAPQIPETIVTVNGNRLVYGTDYTVSGVGVNPSVYECVVKGTGVYGFIEARRAVFVLPGNITSVKNSSKSGKVSISWDNQGGFCFYEVYVYDSGSKKWRLMAKTDKASYSSSYVYKKGKKVKVSANSSYKFKIRGYYDVIVNGVVYNKCGQFTELSIATPTKAPAISKVKKGNKKLTASWKRISGASGYEIQCATDSKFKKNKKTVTVKKGKTTSATVKSLKAKKIYYVRIRAYKTVGSKKIYSAYSKVVKVKL